MAKTCKNKSYSLNKSDKLSICRKAYDRIFNTSKDDLRHSDFICVAIEAELPYEWIEDNVKAYVAIPEMLDYKPSDRKLNYVWFSTDSEGMERRKEVLLELIRRFSE